MWPWRWRTAAIFLMSDGWSHVCVQMIVQHEENMKRSRGHCSVLTLAGICLGQKVQPCLAMARNEEKQMVLHCSRAGKGACVSVPSSYWLNYQLCELSRDHFLLFHF